MRTNSQLNCIGPDIPCITPAPFVTPYFTIFQAETGPFVNNSNLARWAELDSLFTKTYEDNTSGKLSDERFMMITKRYDDEQLSLKKKISALQAEIDAEEKSKHSAASFLQTVKKYTDIQELTPTILNELVEKIVVYPAEGTGKGRTQRFEIHYNYIGTLDPPEVACLPQSVMIDTRQGVAVEYIARKAG
jgi:site-specific DNA recombinase